MRAHRQLQIHHTKGRNRLSFKDIRSYKIAPGVPPAGVVTHAPPEDFMAAGGRIVKYFPITQNFPL